MKTNPANFARWWMVVIYAGAMAWVEDGLKSVGRSKIFDSLVCQTIIK